MCIRRWQNQGAYIISWTWCYQVAEVAVTWRLFKKCPRCWWVVYYVFCFHTV